MSLQTRQYGEGTSVTQRLPFGLYSGAKALCPDGKVRTVKRIAETADTFFSVPAAVAAKGKTVAGFITFVTRSGLSTETPDDPLIVKFVPYTYRKNHVVFGQQVSS